MTDAVDRVRLDWVVDLPRTTVEPSTLGEVVYHYSIPVLDETGRGQLEESNAIESNKSVVQAGDVLVSKLNPRKLRVVEVAPQVAPIVASTEFIRLVPRRIDKRFLTYWLQSESTRQFLDGAVQSVTRSHQRVKPEILTRMWLDLPGDDRQRAIADYLDTETARIDALIAKKRLLIERLLERRAAVTMSFATGANVAGPRSDSLPWGSTTPATWPITKLTNVARLGSGHTPSRSVEEYWAECTIPWITTGEVQQIRDDRIEYLGETREKISRLGVANSGAVVHPAGTVVLSRTASAGFSAIMATDMATSQDFATWTCGPLLEPRYLLLCLRAMRGDLMGRLAMGSTHQTIYMPDIQSIRIPLPPREVQERIVDGAWTHFRRIDAATDLLGSQIAKLMERRQAAITSAVTRS